MRTELASPLPSLLGSLGVHGCAVLTLVLAVRQPVPVANLPRERPDAWAGSALEVDAVATPEAAPSPQATAEIAARAETPATAPSLLEPDAKSATKAGERVTSVPPRSKPPARPKAAGAIDAFATPGAMANGTPRAASGVGAFGSEGLPPGVRSLPTAFTRAIPPATGADPIWQRLPAGVELPFTIAISVDDDGHISDSEIVADAVSPQISTQAAHLRERVVALLGGGLFALQAIGGGGRQLFRVTVTLSDRPVPEQDSPAELVERGFEPPRGATLGRAYFTLASGRHFEATVQVLSSGRDHK